MLRPLAAALVSGAVLATAPAAIASSPAPAITGSTTGRPGAALLGTWQGKVRDDDGAVKPYRVKVRISRSKQTGMPKARVVYPYCTGHWRYVHKDAPWQVFTETISRDPGITSCVPRLTVKVKRVDARLYVKWVYHQRKCHMRAHRVT